MHQRHRQTSIQRDQDEQCVMGWLEGSVSSGRSKLGEGQQGPGPQLEPSSSVPEGTVIAGSRPGQLPGPQTLAVW